MAKICVMTSVHPHDDIRVYRRQARTLAGAGHQVFLLNHCFSGGDDVGIHFVQVPVEEGRAGRMAQASRHYLRAARATGADVFHFHDPELIPAGLALAREGQAVVYDVHEDLPRQIKSKDWIPQLLRPGASRLAGAVEQVASHQFAGVIGATPQIAARFAGGVAICNYPDPAEFGDTRLPFDQRPAQVAYVGAITENRGLFPMLGGLTLARARLALAGEFEEESLRQRAQAHEAWHQVDYAGLLDRRQIAALLGSCRAGLVLLRPTPAYLRSMPIKLFEYMMAGLPVIASDFPFWRRLVGEEGILYVNPADCAEIRQAIDYLVSHPAQAQAMGEAGRRQALARFSYPTEAKKLLALYEQLTTRPGKEGTTHEHSAH